MAAPEMSSRRAPKRGISSTAAGRFGLYGASADATFPYAPAANSSRSFAAADRADEVFYHHGP
jgi:hypothetical protein